MCLVGNPKDNWGRVYGPAKQPWETQQPWGIQQEPLIWPSPSPSLGTYVTTSLTPIVVEPKFKASGPGYSLKLSLLGYDRESVSVKVVNGDLVIMASGGGLEGDESVAHTVKIPKDADQTYDVTLLNGVLTVTTELKPVEEVVLTIR